MAKRAWRNVELELPPVSTAKARWWLELWIPERAQGETLDEKRAALLLGQHMGGGKFRLAGNPNATAETVSHWRYLAGEARPITEAVTMHKATA